eukprot:Sspe_Gene.81538::Locus_52381_Transcript_1_1_Confidence_1.000_Length_4700::g.81538::m.81538
MAEPLLPHLPGAAVQRKRKTVGMRVGGRVPIRLPAVPPHHPRPPRHTKMPRRPRSPPRPSPPHRNQSSTSLPRGPSKAHVRLQALLPHLPGVPFPAVVRIWELCCIHDRRRVGRFTHDELVAFFKDLGADDAVGVVKQWAPLGDVPLHVACAAVVGCLPLLKALPLTPTEDDDREKKRSQEAGPETPWESLRVITRMVQRTLWKRIRPEATATHPTTIDCSTLSPENILRSITLLQAFERGRRARLRANDLRVEQQAWQCNLHCSEHRMAAVEHTPIPEAHLGHALQSRPRYYALSYPGNDAVLMIDWVDSLPSAWRRTFPLAREVFEEEDIVCPPSYRHHPREPAGRCCMAKALWGVLQDLLRRDGVRERAMLQHTTPLEMVEGVTAVFLWLWEGHYPLHKGRGVRPLQIHSVVTATMDALSSRRPMPQSTRQMHTGVVDIFRPLIWRLDTFLGAVIGSARYVPRSVPHLFPPFSYLAYHPVPATPHTYPPDHLVPLPSFTPTFFTGSLDPRPGIHVLLANYRSLAAIPLGCLKRQAMGPIFPPSTFANVLHRFGPPLSTMLRSRHTVVVLGVDEVQTQRGDTFVRLPLRGDEASSEVVGLQLRATRLVVPYCNFSTVYVIPRIRTSDGITVPLDRAFEAHRRRVTLIVAPPREGKTAALLWVMEKLLCDESLPVPAYVDLTSRAGAYSPQGMVQAVLSSLCIRQDDAHELTEGSVCALLDGLGDGDTRGVGEALHAIHTLSRMKETMARLEGEREALHSADETFFASRLKGLEGKAKLGIIEQRLVDGDRTGYISGLQKQLTVEINQLKAAVLSYTDPTTLIDRGGLRGFDVVASISEDKAHLLHDVAGDEDVAVWHLLPVDRPDVVRHVEKRVPPKYHRFLEQHHGSPDLVALAAACPVLEDVVDRSPLGGDPGRWELCQAALATLLSDEGLEEVGWSVSRGMGHLGRVVCARLFRGGRVRSLAVTHWHWHMDHTPFQHVLQFEHLFHDELVAREGVAVSETAARVGLVHSVPLAALQAEEEAARCGVERCFATSWRSLHFPLVLAERLGHCMDHPTLHPFLLASTLVSLGPHDRAAVLQRISLSDHPVALEMVSTYSLHHSSSAAAWAQIQHLPPHVKSLSMSSSPRLHEVMATLGLRDAPGLWEVFEANHVWHMEHALPRLGGRTLRGDMCNFGVLATATAFLRKSAIDYFSLSRLARVVLDEGYSTTVSSLLADEEAQRAGIACEVAAVPWMDREGPLRRAIEVAEGMERERLILPHVVVSSLPVAVRGDGSLRWPHPNATDFIVAKALFELPALHRARLLWNWSPSNDVAEVVRFLSDRLSRSPTEVVAQRLVQTRRAFQELAAARRDRPVWAGALDLETLTTLSVLGADINLVCDANGRSVLQREAHLGEVDNMAVLKRLGADLDLQDVIGYSPLHEAARWGHRRCLQKLRELGATVDIRDNLGCTALHVAARFNQLACLKTLLRMGAQPTALDADGNTPLHLAAANGHARCVSLLVEIRGMVDKTNYMGETAADVAHKRGHRRIHDTLRHWVNES